MKFEWKEYTIGDLCDTISDTYKRNDEEVILINTSDVLDGNVLNHKAVKNKNLKGQFKKTFRHNDILYSEIRPANKRFAFVDFDNTEKYIASTKLMVLRAHEDVVLPQYLFAILKSQKVIETLQHLAETRSGTFPQITFSSELAPMNVMLPDIVTQKQIIAILSVIECKIKLNNKINANLEQQAQAIFKSWFVDFEPFDEIMINSPMNYQVPQSLKIVQISEIPHILETGKRPKGGAVSEGILSIGAENVKQLGKVDFSSAKYIPVEFAANMKKGEVHGYEVMIYKDGGKPGTFIPHFSMFGEGFPCDQFFINEHVFKLDFGNHGYNEFCYFYLQTDYAYNWLANNGTKAAVPGINQQDINSIWIPHPNNPQVKKFCEWVQPIFTTILRNCTQNVKLVKLRDTLLPKLMSGEIDVSDITI